MVRWACSATSLGVAAFVLGVGLVLDDGDGAHTVLRAGAVPVNRPASLIRRCAVTAMLLESMPPLIGTPTRSVRSRSPTAWLKRFWKCATVSSSGRYSISGCSGNCQYRAEAARRRRR